MNPYLLRELQSHYLELCDETGQPPNQWMQVAIDNLSHLESSARELGRLRHVAETANSSRDLLEKVGCWALLDALREAGFEDPRILRSLTPPPPPSDNREGESNKVPSGA